MIEEVKNRVEKFKENVEKVSQDEKFTEKFPDIIKTAVSGIRIGTSVAAIPVVFGLKVTSKLMPVLWETAVQIVHIPAALISKVVNSDSPYNGQKINKVGNFLGTATEKAFDTTAKVVESVAKYI